MREFLRGRQSPDQHLIWRTSTPELIKKHLKPLTPASSRWTSSCALPGMMPPQKPTSQFTPTDRASARFACRFTWVVVGGIEFRGMSMRVVTPPLIAAMVPL